MSIKFGKKQWHAKKISDLKFFEAISSGQVSIVRQYLRQPEANLQITNEKGQSPLSLAIGNLEILNILCNEIPNVVDGKKYRPAICPLPLGNSSSIIIPNSCKCHSCQSFKNGSNFGVAGYSRSCPYLLSSLGDFIVGQSNERDFRRKLVQTYLQQENFSLENQKKFLLDLKKEYKTRYEELKNKQEPLSIGDTRYLVFYRKTHKFFKIWDQIKKLSNIQKKCPVYMVMLFPDTDRDIDHFNQLWMLNQDLKIDDVLIDNGRLKIESSRYYIFEDSFAESNLVDESFIINYQTELSYSSIELFEVIAYYSKLGFDDVQKMRGSELSELARKAGIIPLFGQGCSFIMKFMV